MRARELTIEQSNKKLSGNAAEALPPTFILPKFKAQDPYMQYRMGMAIASARAVAKGEVEFEPESVFSQDMVVVARTKEEEEQLKMALKMIPGHGEKIMVSTAKSQESLDTNTKSPLAKTPVLKRRS